MHLSAVQRSILIIGYGNPGRGDDGLGPALATAAEALGLPGVTVESDYQLTVDHAAMIAGHDLVVFADAMIGLDVPCRMTAIAATVPETLGSHQVSPEAALALAGLLFGHAPKAWMLAIGGQEFGEVKEGLSPVAEDNLARATGLLCDWIAAERGAGRAAFPDTAPGGMAGVLPLPKGFAGAPQVVAFGGQMKGAFCLLKGKGAHLSGSLGELDDLANWTAFLTARDRAAALFDHHPVVAACDLHPLYRTSPLAAASGLPVVGVQHHHAHLAACLGDNLWPLEGGPVAGIVLDGIGMGDDGALWGAEVLLGDYRAFRRVAGLAPAPLIGGDAAARDPVRNLLARLDQAGLGAVMDALYPEMPRVSYRRMVAGGVNVPMASSMGRLFDAFAAALQLLPGRQSHEAEAAMGLEALAARDAGMAGGGYPMLSDQAGVIDPAPLFQAWAADRAAGVSAVRMAARFHAGVAEAFAAPARTLVRSGAARAVALSGGCFQNAVLLEMTVRALGDVPVLIHRATPAHDGGLAFGQALIAAARGM